MKFIFALQLNLHWNIIVWLPVNRSTRLHFFSQIFCDFKILAHSILYVLFVYMTYSSPDTGALYEDELSFNCSDNRRVRIRGVETSGTAVEFEVLMKTTVFCVVTPCSLEAA